MIETEILFQVSLAAAFVAGMVALFAPCCISFLLPAYLGSIFRERRQVLLMTFIYSLGIFVVMLPIVLGARALSQFFFEMHDWTYMIGGAFMIVVGLLAALGVKLPLPHISMKRVAGKTDATSIFILGVLSGVTSACCAPVLVGAMALSTLSPTFLQALGVGMMYVAGMVAPLYLAAVMLDRGNILQKPILQKQLATVGLLGKEYKIMMANAVAGVFFVIVGGVTLVLAAAGKISMPSGTGGVMQWIGVVALRVTQFTDRIPGFSILFTVVVLYVAYRLFRQILFNNKDEDV